MKPVWIFDFIKKGSVESFFTTYHNALLQSSNGKVIPKWYHVTEGLDNNETLNTLEDEAKNILIDIQVGEVVYAKKIPAWDQNNNKDLNVVFVGDIHNTDAQQKMLQFAEKLISNRNYFPPSANLRFYALLWRSANCSVQALTPSEEKFIADLQAMMGKNINNRFHKVLFFESSIIPKEKEKAIASMVLAALHIATHESLGNGDELTMQDNHKFYNANAVGVFYEKDVHKEQEAFYISNIILQSLVAGEDEFPDPNEVATFLNKQEGFFNAFSATSIAESLKLRCPEPSSRRNEYCTDSEVSPFSLNLRHVWNKYFRNYIVNLKRNIVNTTKKVLVEFVSNFKETLYREQVKFANKAKQDIENKVFAIFKDPQQNVISIPQALNILNNISTRIQAQAKDIDAAKIVAFEFPAYLKGAREQVLAEAAEGDSNTTISILEGKLRKHPVLFFSKLVRAFVVGAILSYSSCTFFMDGAANIVTWGIGILLFLIPFGVAFWGYKEHIVRLEALKDQYVAALLLKCQKELDEELKRCVKQTYEDIGTIIKWIRTQKLEYLQRNLSVIAPPKFSFVSSPRFQPLLNYMSYELGEKNQLLIPTSILNIEANKQQPSGSFGVSPIIKNPPTSRVIYQNIPYSLHDVTANTQQGVQLRTKLIKGLLSSQIKAGGNVEQNLQFEAIRTTRTKLLLLDVSGSMSDSMDGLKQAVERLATTASIKWVAFNDTVVATGDTADEFNNIGASGGTEYIPAFKKAQEICSEMLVDQVILISDGAPFEDISDIMLEATKLNQPIHTISIGEVGASVMQQISSETNGEQIIVDNLSQIEQTITSSFNYVFSLGLDGEYAFAELMQKCYIAGCAEALHKFAISILKPTATSIVDLIAEYASDEGMAEWKSVSNPTCMHSAGTTAPEPTTTYIQMVYDSSDESKITPKFDRFDNNKLCKITNTPEILVSTLTLRHIGSIDDLAWVNSEKRV